MSISIPETTVGMINEVSVAVSGIYREGGQKVVDLTVNREKQVGKAVDDVIDCGGQEWKITGIRKGLFARRGEVTFVKI